MLTMHAWLSILPSAATSWRLPRAKYGIILIIKAISTCSSSGKRMRCLEAFGCLRKFCRVMKASFHLVRNSRQSQDFTHSTPILRQLHQHLISIHCIARWLRPKLKPALKCSKLLSNDVVASLLYADMSELLIT